MLLWPFNKYPGTDYETFNWEWILKTVKDWNAKLTVFQEDFMDAIKNSNLTKLLTDILVSHPELSTFGILPYVTPEMYGAAGDGATDDTEAFNAAIASGKHIIAWQHYKVSDTLTLANAQITGTAGARITYTGNNTLFNIQNGYRKPGIIKNIELCATADNVNTVGMYIDRGSWGGSVIAENVDISGFYHPFITDNAYNYGMTNVRTISDGFNIISGDDSTSHFSNKLYFECCHFMPESTHCEKLIQARNVLNVLFESCTFEACDIAVDMENCRYFTFSNGWEEDVDVLYNLTGTSWEPQINMLSMVRSGVTSNTEIERWESAAYSRFYKQKNADTTDRLYQIRANEALPIFNHIMVDTNNNYTEFIGITSKRFDYKLPHNNIIQKEENTDHLDIDLTPLVYNTVTSSKFHIFLIAKFADGSYNSYDFNVFSPRQNNNLIRPNNPITPHNKSTWGTGSTTDLTLTIRTTGITATLSNTATKFEMYLTYELGSEALTTI